MARRFAIGLAVLSGVAVLIAGCADAPRVSRQVGRAVLGEIFVISD